MENATANTSEGYVIESLTKHEINKIKKMVLGYGKFKRTAEAAGMPATTLRDIIHKGYGTPHNIQKIRSNLLEQQAA